jgi:hypothetical protein
MYTTYVHLCACVNVNVVGAPRGHARGTDDVGNDVGGDNCRSLWRQRRKLRSRGNGLSSPPPVLTKSWRTLGKTKPRGTCTSAAVRRRGARRIRPRSYNTRPLVRNRTVALCPVPQVGVLLLLANGVSLTIMTTPSVLEFLFKNST